MISLGRSRRLSLLLFFLLLGLFFRSRTLLLDQDVFSQVLCLPVEFNGLVNGLQRVLVELCCRVVVASFTTEEGCHANCRLVAHANVVLGLRTHLVLEVRHPSDNDESQVKCFDRAWFGCNTTLNLAGIKLWQTNANTITLLDARNRFAEHLHRLDLFVLLESWKFDCVSDGCGTGKHRPSHDGSLALDLEAVIDCE